MPIPKQVIGEARLVVDRLYQGIVVLEICPDSSRSCKRTLVFLLRRVLGECGCEFPSTLNSSTNWFNPGISRFDDALTAAGF